MSLRRYSRPVMYYVRPATTFDLLICREFARTGTVARWFVLRQCALTCPATISQEQHSQTINTMRSGADELQVPTQTHKEAFHLQ